MFTQQNMKMSDFQHFSNFLFKLKRLPRKIFHVISVEWLSVRNKVLFSLELIDGVQMLVEIIFACTNVF